MSARLSDQQITCLWALAAGSKGSGSNERTLQSLRRRGLAASRWHQGEWLWETTPEGDAALASDPRCEP